MVVAEDAPERLALHPLVAAVRLVSLSCGFHTKYRRGDLLHFLLGRKGRARQVWLLQAAMAAQPPLEHYRWLVAEERLRRVLVVLAAGGMVVLVGRLTYLIAVVWVPTDGRGL